MKTLAHLEAEIAKHSEELKRAQEELQRRQAELAAMTPLQQFAVRLHEIECRHNHTDGCGWFYEFKNSSHEWHGREHQFWLDRATKLCHCANRHEINPAAFFAAYSEYNA